TYPDDKISDIRYSFVILAGSVSEIVGTRDKLPPDYRPLAMHFFYCLDNFVEPVGDGVDGNQTREEHWNMSKNELLAFWHSNKKCNPVVKHDDPNELAKYFPNKPASNWGWKFYSELR
ncbi:MAG: hypothetical protein HQL44_16795, partial [Alphaproteobacteria bacterium]|nr:hypothetical protein [Alphaproteobacteria bacterium]